MNRACFKNKGIILKSSQIKTLKSIVRGNQSQEEDFPAVLFDTPRTSSRPYPSVSYLDKFRLKAKITYFYRFQRILSYFFIKYIDIRIIMTFYTFTWGD